MKIGWCLFQNDKAQKKNKVKKEMKSKGSGRNVHIYIDAREVDVLLIYILFTFVVVDAERSVFYVNCDKKIIITR